MSTKDRLLDGVILISLLILFLGCFFISYSDKDANMAETVPTASTTAVVKTTQPTTTTTTEETKPTSAYDYTEEELDLLARLIYSEGGNTSYDTQLMIGSVVMNRVDDPNFPDTIREVIYQDNQFSVTFIRIDGVVMIDRPASEESKQAALEILTYGSILPQKVQVFYLSSITSGWVASREPYKKSDNVQFSYIYRREG